MELPIENTIPLNGLDLPPGADIEEWNEAYEKVEAYLRSLRVRNKLLIARLNFKILQRAQRRMENYPLLRPTEAAIEETVAFVNTWCEEVIGEEISQKQGRISTRSRLALLIVDMPQRYQNLFLTEGPWPDQFVKEMRESLLRSGPDFQISQMTPRPIDLGPVRKLTQLQESSLTWRLLPALLMLVIFLFILHSISDG